MAGRTAACLVVSAGGLSYIHYTGSFGARVAPTILSATAAEAGFFGAGLDDGDTVRVLFSEATNLVRSSFAKEDVDQLLRAADLLAEATVQPPKTLHSHSGTKST